MAGAPLCCQLQAPRCAVLPVPHEGQQSDQARQEAPHHAAEAAAAAVAEAVAGGQQGAVVAAHTPA